MKPDPKALARRLHKYMSSPDYEGGDGPATALAKVEAAIRTEYGDLEAKIGRLQKQEKWLKLGHEVADGFLDGPSQSHIVDKICIIGHERDELQTENKRLRLEFEGVNCEHRAKVFKAKCDEIERLQAIIDCCAAECEPNDSLEVNERVAVLRSKVDRLQAEAANQQT